MNNILEWVIVTGWLGFKACVLLFWIGLAVWVVGLVRKIDVWEPNKAASPASAPAPSSQMDEAFESWMAESNAYSFDPSNWPDESEVPALFRSRYHEYLVEQNA